MRPRLAGDRPSRRSGSMQTAIHRIMTCTRARPSMTGLLRSQSVPHSNAGGRSSSFARTRMQAWADVLDGLDDARDAAE